MTTRGDENELELLLEAVYRRYHHYFRGYVRSSLRRKVAGPQSSLGSPTVAHLLDRDLQDRAIGLFRDALCPRGFLGLGTTEMLRFSAHALCFEPFAADEHLHRRV